MQNIRQRAPAPPGDPEGSAGRFGQRLLEPIDRTEGRERNRQMSKEDIVVP
jgi:hypothetical protein